MIRAAAKNHAQASRSWSTRRTTTRSCAELEERAATLGAEPATGLADKAFAQTARYDAAIARWFSRSDEATSSRRRLAVACEKALRPALRREPAPARGALPHAGRGPASLAAVQKSARQGALLQQPARPRRGALALCATSTRPPASIVKHNNPCGVAIGGDPRARPTAGRAPATRSRPSAASSPSTGRSTWRSPRQLAPDRSSRSSIAPGFDAEARRDPAAEEADAGPARSGARAARARGRTRLRDAVARRGSWSRTATTRPRPAPIVEVVTQRKPDRGRAGRPASSPGRVCQHVKSQRDRARQGRRRSWASAPAR